MQSSTAAMFLKWRDHAVATHGADAVGAFVRQHGDLIEALAADFERASKAPKKVRERVARNIAALRILEKKSEKFTSEELATLEGYTGWGGLPDECIPASYSEIDEYYTPRSLAASIGVAISQLVADLATGGSVTALEPSAGIGNLMRGVDHASPRVSICWTAVERSKQAAKILRALRPGEDHVNTTFETWVSEHGPAAQGRYHLVVANPPYAARGLTTDVPAKYREGPAYAFFLRRCLDLLAPGGLAVFIIPASFLSSEIRRDLRGRVLSRSRLVAAYRLPRRTFPGADRLTDVVVLRARSGVHTVAPEEEYIADGAYFERYPDHVLSSPDLPQISDESTPCNVAEESDVQSLPTPQPPTASAAALALGRRIRSCRKQCGDGSDGCDGLWGELSRDLEDFVGSSFVATCGHANPWEWPELTGDGANEYRQAFTRRGRLSISLQHAPARVVYRGSPDNLANQASWLYRQAGRMSVDTLFELHRSVGGQLERGDVAALPGWNVCHDGAMQPDEDYFAGDLWAKLDDLRGLQTDKAREQAARLQSEIAAIPVEDIEDLSPRAGWMPVAVLTGWINALAVHNAVESDPLTLERVDGSILVAGVEYEDTQASVAKPLADVIAWLNYDVIGDEHGWTDDFTAWACFDPERRQLIASAYNRAVRGFRCRQHAPDSLDIPRWDPGVRLHAYQRAAAQQMQETGGGLIAFDTGLGKTYAGLALLAAARRDGEARRPVILVPRSLAWKWYGAILRALPDYRVCVIGTKQAKRERGREFRELLRQVTEGEITKSEFEAARFTSRSDSPRERREKWDAFRGGAYDVVIMTLPTLEHIGLAPDTRDDYRESLGPLAQQLGDTTNEGPLAWNVDFLIVDEIQKFKNLFAPHEDYRPRYMGTPDPSRRARQLHALAYATRDAGGRVYGVTATPADNSPLELYNLLHIVNPAIWERAGLYSPMAFVDRYIQVEDTAVPDSKFRLVEKPAAVGFKNLNELWGIVCRYTAFQRAEESGLKLPIARNHVIEVDVSKRQAAKIARYIEHLTTHPHDFLGTQIKLSLVAVHADLDGGYTWDSAASINPESPKLKAIAERVIATDCNHIVFLENPAAQRWMHEVLARAGLPRGRMAVLNGATAAAERQKIATAFNRGTYKVVIANSVAHEGLDLQLRTCGIHHGDLPWGPKGLEQRNGRAVRQNNPFEAVEVFYYVARGTVDRYRLSLIHGKATWLRALDGSKDQISNPAADLFIDRDDMLMHFSDGADREALLEQRKRAQLNTKHKQVSRAASRLAYRMAARFRDAREARDTEVSTRRHCEGSALLRELAQVDGRMWPWAPWMGVAREVMPLVPRDGSAPVFEGLRISRHREALHFGRPGYDGGQAIGVRRASTGLWVPMSVADVAALDIQPGDMPGRTLDPWPVDDDDRAVAWVESHAKRLRGIPWPQWGWQFASDRWVSSVWPRVSAVVAYNVQKNTRQPLPIMRETLELAYGSDVLGNLLPPTLKGWRVFVAWAAHSELAEEDLEAAGRYWWGRELPRRDA